MNNNFLFFNLNDLISHSNLELNVLEAEKHPENPLLPLGTVHEWDAVQARPWETRNVIFDKEENIFKCWYSGTNIKTERWWASGYATSKDGITWEKPKLGLYEYNGSKENNIFSLGWGPVYKDLKEPDPAKRYKMLVKGPKDKMEEWGIRLAYSADGIHFYEKCKIRLPEWQQDFPDIVALWCDDDEDESKRYKIIWQEGVESKKPGPKRIRAKFLGYGPDLENLRSCPANPILTPNNSTEEENHFVMAFPWKGWTILLYEYGWYNGDNTGYYGRYCADIRLAVSRDGENFTRINPEQKVISCGGCGQWDNGFLVISAEPIIKDGKFHLYYCGNGDEWTNWPASNDPECNEVTFGLPGATRNSRMGLATCDLDRLTCIETTDKTKPAEALIPLNLKTEKITVNISKTEKDKSFLTAELLDAETREPITGFTEKECPPLSSDSFAEEIKWKDNKLPEDEVILKIILNGEVRLHGVEA
jgi:hypothetical protein